MKKTLALFIAFFSFATISAMAQDAGQQQSANPPQGRRQGRGQGGGNFQMRGTAGTITAINGNTITVKQAGNDETVTVKLSDKTEYRKMPERPGDGQGMPMPQPAKLSDFKVGDSIMVRGERSSPTEVDAATVMLAPPGGARFMMRGGPAGPGGGGPGGMPINAADLGKTFIAGEVKSIDGAKLTVHRPDGQDQTIQADENTSFRKGRESITLPDIKIGDTIMGRGEIKDGVFTPATLNVVDPRAMQMMRQRANGQEKPQSPPPPPQ